MDALKAFCRQNSKEDYFLLKGYAGTGKTTTINSFIDWYVENKSILLDDVVVTAPTNKAVRVLKDMSVNTKVEYKTLASLLGLRPKITVDGDEVFEKDPSVKQTLFNFGVVIVDESSMIDDNLFDILLKEGSQQKFIFVGDACQVPPISHAHSKPMMPDVQKKMNFKVVELTEIVRQAAENPIIQVATSIRKGTFSLKISKNLKEDGTGVIQLDKTNKEELFKLIKDKFCSPEFDEDANYAKVICWRNKTVDAFNGLIRSFIYQRGVNRLVIGEKILLNKPIIDGKGRNAKVLLNINDDLVINELTIEKKKYFDKELKFYKAKVSKDYNKSTSHIIEILHEDSDAVFMVMLNNLKKIAISSASKDRGNAWHRYYEFRNTFADFSYNYAITTHKSQGSTYDNAFVVYSDISVNPNKVEMQRIFYTAASRPSKTLFIL